MLSGDADTPLPWVNVLANEHGGAVVGATGSAWTWAGNSRENRLTPFDNDPVKEFTGEALYLRDEDTGRVWGATPGPLPRARDGGRWVTRFGAGVTRYSHAEHGVACEHTMFVDADEPVRFSLVQLTNRSDRRRRLGVFGYQEWMLGPPRVGEQRFVVTEPDAATGAVLATQRLQHRLRPARGVRVLGARAAIIHRRPHRVPRPQRLAAHARGPRPHRAVRARRRRARPVRRAAGARRSRAGRDAHRGAAARPGRRSRARPVADPAPARRRGGSGVAGRGRAALGRAARHGARRDAGRLVRPADEPLAALPDDGVAALGAHRVLPAGRRVRLPRPAAGRDGAGVRGAPSSTGEHLLAARRASSSRATCSTGGIRAPGAACARAAPTTCCGCRTPWRATCPAPATRACSTSRCRSSRRHRWPLATTRPTTCRTSRRRCARCTSTACARSSARWCAARTACR